MTTTTTIQQQLIEVVEVEVTGDSVFEQHQSWVIDDCKIDLRIVYDECGDPTDYLGRFSDKPINQHSILVEEPDYIILDYFGNNNYYRRENPIYYTPACEEYAQEEMKRLVDFYKQHWFLMGVIVELYKLCPCCNQYTLVSEDSIWGCESDCPESIKEYANNMVQVCVGKL